MAVLRRQSIITMIKFTVGNWNIKVQNGLPLKPGNYSSLRKWIIALRWCSNIPEALVIQWVKHLVKRTWGSSKLVELIAGESSFSEASMNARRGNHNKAMKRDSMIVIK